MTPLETLCEEYLAAQRSTLWGRAWDINDPKNRPQAAKWLAEQVRGLTEVMHQHAERQP